MAIVKVEGTTFVRDTKTMALINTDVSGLEEYKTKTSLINNQKNEINKVKNEIKDIRNDVQIIKELLMQLSRKQ
jgi:hypothetical protein